MIKSFSTTNDRIFQIKWQLIEWRKIITNYKSDRRLVCTLYKELKHWTSIKHITEIKNEQLKIELSRKFLKDETQIIESKKYSTPLVFREMQIKYTLRFCLLLVRTAKFQQMTAHAGVNAGKQEHLLIAGGWGVKSCTTTVD